MTTIPLVISHDDPRFAEHTRAFALDRCVCPRTAHPAPGAWPPGTALGVVHHVLGCQHYPTTRHSPCPYAGCEPRILVTPHRRPSPGGIHHPRPDNQSR